MRRQRNRRRLCSLSPGVEGEGFEPSKAEPADLQSAPFDRSGTPPSKRAILAVAAPRGQTSAAYEVPLEPREEDLYNQRSGARPPERHLRRGRPPPAARGHAPPLTAGGRHGLLSRRFRIDRGI